MQKSLRPESLSVSFLSSIDELDESDYQALLEQTQTTYPFLQWGFLQALEHSQSCSKKMGWLPRHAAVFDGEQLIAFMPCYEKHHSYGEYVFDSQWANAYHQHGLQYYPKLITGIPFTPCAGPRYVALPDLPKADIEATLLAAIKQFCEARGYSGWHVLFNKADECTWLSETLPVRYGVQFHWYNQSYESFEAFLQTFTSRKRKAIKKERKAVADQDFSLEVLEGAQVTPELWETFYHFYQLTYAKRSGHGGYLNQAFFEHVGKAIPNNIVLVLAKKLADEVKGEVVDKHAEVVAGALYFKDDETLYGRYWGCYAEFDFLHFEACYYQGIEYAIAHGLKHIDAGAQGEHKIQRGFEPILTQSLHYLVDAPFDAAIRRFVLDEKPHIEAYRQECFEALPYKKVGN